MSEDKSLSINHVESSFGARMFEHDDLADEAENPMIKLKFLTYKLGTIVFVAVSLVTDETKTLLDKIADIDSYAKIFIEENNVKSMELKAGQNALFKGDCHTQR